MRKGEIRNRALELIENGWTKENAFEKITEECPNHPMVIAEVIRYITSRKSKIQTLPIWFLSIILIGIFLLIQLFEAINAYQDYEIDILPLLIKPTITLFMFLVVYNYIGESFIWVIFSSFISIFNSISLLTDKESSSIGIVFLILSCTLFVSLVKLRKRLFPKPKKRLLVTS